MGFATLPNQVHRKSVKKGFDFTLMVAGQFIAEEENTTKILTHLMTQSPVFNIHSVIAD